VETKKKRKISNIIMVALIIVVAFCGVMAVGGIRGWFGDKESPVMSDDYTGVVNIERNGVAYAIDKKIPIEPGDLIETKSGSEASFKILEDNLLIMNENAELFFGEIDADSIVMELQQGEVFADMPAAPETFKMDFGGNTATITGTVFSASTQQGSAALNVYEGEVTVDAKDGKQYTVKAGQVLNISDSTDGTADVEAVDLQINSLNSFNIKKLIDCDSSDLCLSKDKLKKMLDQRMAEQEEAAENAEEEVSVSTGNDDGNVSDEKVYSCTITIRCNTILKNMDSLTAGKDRYVPSNGVILATSTVEFVKGETVFDVLQRACSYAGIHLEYSYTPMYESYYIEGINHLYEFDCGPQSGWMYKVNGWYPNYGCSGYELKDGDSIVWNYTCTGLGKDVGAN